MRFAILALAAGLVSTAALAGEDLPDPRGEGVIPLCDSPSVVSAVMERQNWVERNTWHSDLRIQEIGHIKQTYNTTEGMSLIDHRHCRAQAVFNTGEVARVYYVLYEHLGFAGSSYGLNVCLPSRDFYRSFNAECRVLR